MCAFLTVLASIFHTSGALAIEAPPHHQPAIAVLLSHNRPITAKSFHSLPQRRQGVPLQLYRADHPIQVHHPLVGTSFISTTSQGQGTVSPSLRRPAHLLLLGGGRDQSFLNVMIWVDLIRWPVFEMSPLLSSNTFMATPGVV